MVLPEGFVVAKVENWFSNYGNPRSNEIAYVVVPKKMGRKVRGFICPNEAEFAGECGRSILVPYPKYLVGPHRFSEEEAIEYFLLHKDNYPEMKETDVEDLFTP